MKLRRATDADRDLFLEWKNDPEAVQWSLLQVAVTPEEHARWWATTRDQRYVIEGYDGRPQTIVRLGIVDDAAEVSLIVHPGQRGRGCGGDALWEVRKLAGDLGLKRLIARVIPQNTASLRAFLSAGFVVRAVRASGPVHLVMEAEL